MIRTKTGAATLSVASNALLIALKIAAGALTGSIAILTEAAHSSIDLVASVIALISVRKADEPPDPEHPYGHEKVENLAAAIEGMLILVGAGIIVFEATRRLVDGVRGRAPRRRDRGDRLLGGRQPWRLRLPGAPRPRALGSPALEGDAAHLRADALTSIGVLVGLGLVADDRQRRLRPDRRAGGRGGDRVRRASDPHGLLAGAGRRGAAARGARPDRGGDRRLPGRRRWSATTSCAPAAPGLAPLHRPPRPVSLRDDARGCPRARPSTSATRSRPRSRTPTC